MSSSREGRVTRPALRALATLALAFWPAVAAAQTPAPGFAVERLYPAPAGGGWFVMDDLAMPDGLGGAAELTLGYARDPLVVGGARQRLSVVSDQAFADLGAAVSWGRFRLSLDLPVPLLVAGQSGTSGAYLFTAPAVNLGTNPDSLTDARIGFDLRLLGHPGDRLRLGVGAQLFVPSNAPLDTPANYLTDGTVRAMFRALAAGDVGPYRWAAQAGVHLRPLNEAPVPGAPAGSELLFGAAAGRSFALAPGWQAVVGPELFGDTAFASFLGNGTTGVEGLLTGRFERTGAGAQLRLKIGGGGGLDPQFGAPAWRVLVAVELFSRPAPK
ncbi:MAG: hypothetical protein ACYDCL_06205 [Myxococcales bacterium]